MVLPEVLEERLNELGSDRPSISHTFRSGDAVAAMRWVTQLECYLMRYLHQSMATVRALTFSEATELFEVTVDIVRVENGKPPRGEVDPEQEWS